MVSQHFMCFVLFSTLNGTQIIYIITFITEITVAYGIQQILHVHLLQRIKILQWPLQAIKGLIQSTQLLATFKRIHAINAHNWMCNVYCGEFNRHSFTMQTWFFSAGVY